MALNQCWFDAGPASQTVASIGPELGQRLVFAGSVDKPHCVLHIGVVPKRNNKLRLIAYIVSVNRSWFICCWEGHITSFFVYKTFIPSSFIMSPLLYTEVGLPLTAQWVCPFCLSFLSVQWFLSCRRSKAAPSNKRRGPNAGLMLAYSLRCWANISQVLGNRVVFGAILNVGQRHRQLANINTALFQSIVLI